MCKLLANKKRGGIPIAPQQSTCLGQGHQAGQLSRIELINCGSAWNFLQALWLQQRHAPSQPHQPHRWTWPVTPTGNWPNSLAPDHQWTWRCSNKHSWVHEIKHRHPFFWPDCSLWTKMQRKIAPMMMKRKAFQPGWKGTGSTEANPGCSTAKTNHLRTTNKFSTFLPTNPKKVLQLHRSLDINYIHRYFNNISLVIE